MEIKWTPLKSVPVQKPKRLSAAGIRMNALDGITDSTITKCSSEQDVENYHLLGKIWSLLTALSGILGPGLTLMMSLVSKGGPKK